MRDQMSAKMDEEAYEAVTDELNDADVVLTLDDLDRKCVKKAERFARQNGFSWPPAVGDFDRYWEQKQNR